MTADFNINGGDFAQTTIDVAPNTDAGLDLWKILGFGGACSATLTKSGGLEFLAAVEAAGLTATAVRGRVENWALFGDGKES